MAQKARRQPRVYRDTYDLHSFGSPASLFSSKPTYAPLSSQSSSIRSLGSFSSRHCA
jgi:hypothetical protein